MTGDRKLELPPLPFLLAAAAGLLLHYQLARHIDPFVARGADFFAFYTGAALLPSGQLYSLEAAQAVARRITDRDEYYPDIRPPWFAALVRPLASLDPQRALLVWRILMCVAVAGFVLLWPAPRLPAFAAAACSFPLFSALATGQDVPLILLWIAAAVFLIRRDQPFSAGLLASLASVKFHLFLFVPLVLAYKRQWRALAGLAAGGVILFTASTLLYGPSWPAQYLRLILDPVTNPHVDSMYNLRGLCAVLGLPPAFEFVLSAVVALTLWLAVRHAGPVPAISAALIAGLLAGHHSYLGDLALLLPAALGLILHARSALLRSAAFLLFLPVPYLAVPVSLAIPLVIGCQYAVLLASAWEARAFRPSSELDKTNPI